MTDTAIGSNWKDVRQTLFTLEEIQESDVRVAIMSALVEVNQEKHSLVESYDDTEFVVKKSNIY